MFFPLDTPTVAPPKTPLEDLQDLYAEWCPDRILEDDMGYYIKYGYFIATPEFILMGKAIKKGASMGKILDPTYSFPREQWDTWFAAAYSGQIKVLLDFWPYKLTWLAWQRRGGCLRYWTLNHFRTCVNKTQTACNVLNCSSSK